MGLLIYSIIVVGLGCWPKLNLPLGFSTLGLRLSLGYATTMILGFLMLIIGLKISSIALILAVLASMGVMFRVRTVNWSAATPIWFLHPCVILIAFGFAAIVLSPELNYLPVSQDEFSHWLAHPLHLNAHGTLKEALEAFSLPGYLPGWPFMLALPWQFSGLANFGWSATAPFVLYVAVSALTYDIVCALLRRHFNLSDGQTSLLSWTFILLFTAAQAIGPLWSRTLLIEAPQIYSAFAFLLLIYTAEIFPSYRNNLEWPAGTILASAYLIKSAAILFAPGVMLIFLFSLLRGRESAKEHCKSFIYSFSRLLGPTISIVLIWALYSDTSGCLFRPLETFSADALSKAIEYDWWDLGSRFFAEIGIYILEYKFILTVTALLGLSIIVLFGRSRTPIIFFAMAASYFAALYWFHLTCFGDFYFRELNSIPRFTRVILWTMHGIGLVILVDVTFTLLRNFGVKRPVEYFIKHKGGVFCTSVLLCVLAMVQINSLWRGIEDVTTRRYQPLDPRIKESSNAAQAIHSLAGSVLPDRPKLLILSQGLDNAVLSYADFFSQARKRGELISRFTVIRESSWAPIPKNIWQHKSDKAQFLRTLKSADIIWPMQVDEWLEAALGTYIVKQKCADDVLKHFIVVDKSFTGDTQFHCYRKNTLENEKKLTNQK